MSSESGVGSSESGVGSRSGVRWLSLQVEEPEETCQPSDACFGDACFYTGRRHHPAGRHPMATQSLRAHSKNLKAIGCRRTSTPNSRLRTPDSTQYAHLIKVAPHVNPPPKAASTILSPFLMFFSKSHRQSGIVAAVVFP